MDARHVLGSAGGDELAVRPDSGFADHVAANGHDHHDHGEHPDELPEATAHRCIRSPHFNPHQPQDDDDLERHRGRFAASCPSSAHGPGDVEEQNSWQTAVPPKATG